VFQDLNSVEPAFSKAARKPSSVNALKYNRSKVPDHLATRPVRFVAHDVANHSAAALFKNAKDFLEKLSLRFRFNQIEHAI